MTENTINDFERFAAQVHPVIEAMGKEKAVLNDMLPQYGAIYYDKV